MPNNEFTRIMDLMYLMNIMNGNEQAAKEINKTRILINNNGLSSKQMNVVRAMKRIQKGNK